MGREWLGIDRLRLDKFYLLIKLFLKVTFAYLSHSQWNNELVTETSKNFKDILLNPRYPDGLKLYYAENMVPQLIAVCSESISPDSDVMLLLLEPYLSVIAYSTSDSVIRTTRDEVLGNLLTVDTHTQTADGKKKEIIQIPYVQIADNLCKLGALKEVQTKNRKIIFSYVDQYRKHAEKLNAKQTTKKRKRKKTKNLTSDEATNEIAKKKKSASKNIEETVENIEKTIITQVKSLNGGGDELSKSIKDTSEIKIAKKKKKKKFAIENNEESVENIEKTIKTQVESSNGGGDELSKSIRDTNTNKIAKKKKKKSANEKNERTVENVTMNTDKTIETQVESSNGDEDALSKSIQDKKVKRSKKSRINNESNITDENKSEDASSDVQIDNIEENKEEEENSVIKGTKVKSTKKRRKSAKQDIGDQEIITENKVVVVDDKNIDENVDHNESSINISNEDDDVKMKLCFLDDQSEDIDINAKIESSTEQVISSSITKTKKKKKKKSLDASDNPEPLFLKTPPPKAFFRKALMKSEPAKKKQRKINSKPILSTPTTEPGKKQFRIDLSKNSAVAHQDLKISPMVPFSPTRRPDRGVLKTPVSMKRANAKDFF